MDLLWTNRVTAEGEWLIDDLRRLTWMARRPYENLRDLHERRLEKKSRKRSRRNGFWTHSLTLAFTSSSGLGFTGIDLNQTSEPPPAHRQTMSRDPPPPEKAPSTADDARTKEARRVIEEYANTLREILQKLRRIVN